MIKNLKILSQKLAEKITHNKSNKSKLKIEREIFAALSYSNCDIDTIAKFVNDCLNMNIWRSEEFFDFKYRSRYNIFDYIIDDDYVPIIKQLMSSTPILGSPNAATGEYELMLLLTSNCSKPTKGDIFHNQYGLKNVKADKPRIFTTVRGKELNKKMKDCLSRYNIPLWVSRGVEYGQLMNKNAVSYYNEQFKKLNLSQEDVETICGVWLQELFKCEVNQEFDFMQDNQIQWEQWINFNVLYIFENSEDRFESFMVMNDSGDVFHIPTQTVEFKNEMNKGNIIYSGNYFRLNQDGFCGIYLKVN